MPAPYKVNKFTSKDAEDLTGLVEAFQDALSKNEDARIEIEGPIVFTDELDTINHGQIITIASAAGTQYLSSWGVAEDINSGYPWDEYDFFRHFYIQNGGLVLENIILCGHDLAATNPGPEEIFYGGVEVRNGGSLRLKQDSIIEYCRGLNAGGVEVKEGGNFLMTSGTLRNCLTKTSIGNLVYNDGNFQLRDGTLHFTTDSHYNGVHLGESGVFVMDGGIIENCVSAVFLERGSRLIFEEGIIRRNDTGIEVNHQSGEKVIVMNNGKIMENRIGVYLTEGAQFTLNNGSISGHLGRDGVGVLATYGSSGSFVMNGGSIYNNVQGLTWQQTLISCVINDGDIYENGYGLAVDNATATVKGGRISKSRIYKDPLENPTFSPLEGGYPVSGMGIMVGFNGTLNLEGGDIFSHERIGIVAIFTGKVNMLGGRIYDNLIGLRLVCSSGVMENGEIFGNQVAGVEVANFQDDFESTGADFTFNGGLIYNNVPSNPSNPTQITWGQGVSVKDNSTFTMNGGEIYGHTSYPQGFGVWCRNRSNAKMTAGRIYKNYKGIELGLGIGEDSRPIFEQGSGSGFIMENGEVDHNTVGVTIWANCSFNLIAGEIHENSGYSEWVTAEGGLGLGVCFGTFTMDGGRIYGHKGFSASWAQAVFYQPVGAGITILFGGWVVLNAGEIFDNEGSTGAAVYVPNEQYGQTPGMQSLIVREEVYFNNNRATDDVPYIYDGSISYVNANIAFSRTSVGAHILNNYDVNYTGISGGFRLTRTLRDYFADDCLAQLVGEGINRNLDDYVAPSEFETITELDAEGCCIRSIAGIQYLTNLASLNVNGNHISDLGPLADLQGLQYEAYDQQITLPQLYVARYQSISPYGTDNEPIEVRLFKYNGVYNDETRTVIWWERGRNGISWGNKNIDKFTGDIYQTVIPIPIKELFPHPKVAAEIAKVLHKMVTSPIDVPELLRINYLDFSNFGAMELSDLEGLEFIFNLQVLNLQGCGIDPIEAADFLGNKAKIKV